MRTCPPIIQACSGIIITPRAQERGESFARAALLASGPCSFMLHDGGVNIWCKFWLQHFRQCQGVVKDAGGWGGVSSWHGLMRKTLTLHPIFVLHHHHSPPNAASLEAFLRAPIVMIQLFLKRLAVWDTSFHLCLFCYKVIIKMNWKGCILH